MMAYMDNITGSNGLPPIADFYEPYDEGDFGTCDYERHGTYFLPPLYSIFFILGLLGNVLVVWVTIAGVRLRSMTDVCLLNLAIADLLLVCSLPFLAHQARDQWPFGEFMFGNVMCKVVLGAYHIGFYCGIFFITLMSIDRYLAIVLPIYALKTRTRAFGMIAAAVTWVAGLFASCSDLAFLQVRVQKADEINISICDSFYNDANATKDRHYWTIFGLFKMNILGLLIPMVIMCFCYGQIIWRLLHSPSSKKHSIRLVLVVVAVFFCCWMPYNVASFFKALELFEVYTACESSNAIKLALQVTEAIAYSHSCINPILYVFVGVKFRKNLLRLMNRAPCGLCQVLKTLIPEDRVTGSTYSQSTSVYERSVRGKSERIAPRGTSISTLLRNNIDEVPNGASVRVELCSTVVPKVGSGDP